MNIIQSASVPTNVLGDIASMYKNGLTYPVVVKDQMNPDGKMFSFGLNGKFGEYPVNERIELKGEEIQHLFSSVFREPVIHDDNGFKRIVGYKTVCRFTIMPVGNPWGGSEDIGAAPTEGAVVLTKPRAAKPVKNISEV